MTKKPVSLALVLGASVLACGAPWQAPPLATPGLDAIHTGPGQSDTGGCLAGRLVSEAGRPLEDILVGAIAETTIAEHPEFWVRRRKVGQGAVGFEIATRTDRNGRFRLDGLRSDRYLLLSAPWGSEHGTFLLALGAVETGSASLELVQPTWEVEVSVLDASGQAVDAAVCRTIDEDLRSNQPTRVAVWSDDRRWSVGPLRRIAPGRYGASVEPGHLYRVAAVDAMGGVPTRTVLVPEERAESDVTLRLAAQRPPATLTIRARLASGDDPEENVGYTVTSLTTDVPLVIDQAPPRGREHTIALPAGRYRVEARPGPLRFCPSCPLPALTLAPSSRELTLEPGAHRSVTLELVRGGRLRITAPEAPGSRRPEELVQLSSWTGVPTWLVTGPPGSTSLRLLPRSGEHSTDLDFERTDCLWFGPVPWLPAGETATTYRPIAPGRYTLEARWKGRVPVRVPVEVRAGETTDVALELPPGTGGPRAGD